MLRGCIILWNILATSLLLFVRIFRRATNWKNWYSSQAAEEMFAGPAFDWHNSHTWLTFIMCPCMCSRLPSSISSMVSIESSLIHFIKKMCAGYKNPHPRLLMKNNHSYIAVLLSKAFNKVIFRICTVLFLIDVRDTSDRGDIVFVQQIHVLLTISPSEWICSLILQCQWIFTTDSEILPAGLLCLSARYFSTVVPYPRGKMHLCPSDGYIKWRSLGSRNITRLPRYSGHCSRRECEDSPVLIHSPVYCTWVRRLWLNQLHMSAAPLVKPDGYKLGRWTLCKSLKSISRTSG